MTDDQLGESRRVPALTRHGWKRAPLIDPELWAYADEVRAFNTAWQNMRAQAARHDIRTPDGLAAMRATMEPGGIYAPASPHAGQFRNRTIPGPDGEIGLRTLTPPHPRAVYLDIHGGGFFGGSPSMSDNFNYDLAVATGVAVVSVDYRRPPEHPYPAANDDCEAAALWLVGQAQAEFGTERLLIGGASAGAHLAACTLLRLRDRHGAASRFLGASLVAGVYDLGMTPSQRLAQVSSGLERDGISASRQLFLVDVSHERLREPAISPLYADLRHLPPALFTVGAIDSLIDDNMFMAARWHLAGNKAELAVYPESPHGFAGFPVEMARRARTRIHEFISRCLDLPRPTFGDASPTATPCFE